MSERETVEVNRFFYEVACVEKAISDEPEYPGKMPDEMWAAINGDRDAMEECLRQTVVETKSGIVKRMKEIQMATVTTYEWKKEASDGG